MYQVPKYNYDWRSEVKKGKGFTQKLCLTFEISRANLGPGCFTSLNPPDARPFATAGFSLGLSFSFTRGSETSAFKPTERFWKPESSVWYILSFIASWWPRFCVVAALKMIVCWLNNTLTDSADTSNRPHNREAGLVKSDENGFKTRVESQWTRGNRISIFHNQVNTLTCFRNGNFRDLCG